METDERRIKAIWNNATCPVILRRGGAGENLRIRICGRKERTYNDYRWLKKPRKHQPRWINKHHCWELPKGRFNDLVKDSIDKFDRVYVVQPYREQEKCSPACQNANGHICQCSCMGENHGANGIDAGWFVVSDTFATKWGKKILACRLMQTVI